MLSASGRSTLHSPSIQKVLRLLAPLSRSESGGILLDHVENLLEAAELGRRTTEDFHASLLNRLLEHCARRFPEGSPQQIHTELLRTHLAPPYGEGEIEALKALGDKYILMLKSTGPAEDAMAAALKPLFEELRHAGSEQVAAASERTSLHEAPVRPPTPPQVDSAYRQHLDQNRQRIERVQESLSAQIGECITSNSSFGAMLEKHLLALGGAGGENPETIRRLLTGEIESLLQKHHDLASELEKTQDYLRLSASNSQRLNDELTRVHQLSLTDDLTGLPNRRAFMRRLEDEVGRVQRYGNPLSLALIDLDGFKKINDQHGHAAGDEVLKTYASTVLSTFRHHDLVARYGGEEFAVILPNTHRDGALRALHKIRKRVPECAFRHIGHPQVLPTFSAGVVLFRAGDTPEQLIERADRALYQAKELGRDRIVADEPTSENVALPG